MVMEHTQLTKMNQTVILILQHQSVVMTVKFEWDLQSKEIMYNIHLIIAFCNSRDFIILYVCRHLLLGLSL